MRYAALMLAIFCLATVAAGAENPKKLLIVTTDRIVQESQQLSAFVIEKERRGYAPFVATETNYGGGDLTGDAKAQLIRTWLGSNAVGYTHILLIGDPHPEHGGIPMVVTRPLHEYPETSTGATPTNVPVDTDMLYVNVTGDWDLNGNGIYGERGDDDGDGGIDFTPDFIVGRIPAYDGDSAGLDRILALTLKYQNMTAAERGYRTTLLFPAGFYFFRGMMGLTADWDSAGLGEWALNTFLKERNDLTPVTLYEQEGVQASTYPSSRPLNRDELLAAWHAGTGIVFWGGHTFSNRILRLVWANDSNGDDQATQSETTMPVLFHADDAVLLSGTQPGFLVSPNCNAGIVSTPDGLTYTLLQYAVVGVMAATEAATPAAMNWDCYDCPFDETAFGSDTAGIAVLRALVDGTAPAAALLTAKRETGSDASALTYANKMMFNWYGDPTLTLATGSEERLPDTDQTPDDDAFSPDPETIPDDTAPRHDDGGCALKL